MQTRLPTGAVAIALGLTGIGASQVLADQVVYDTLATPAQVAANDEYIDQQTGNNLYYVGDTITPASSLTVGQTLTTMKIPFLSTELSGQGSGTYTPNLQLSIFNTADFLANPATATPIATVSASPTFTNDGVVDPAVGYNAEDEQLITFDFSSQNLSLPTNFIIAYHDSNPNAGTDPIGEGLSVLLVGSPEVASPLGAVADQQWLETYPNDPATTGLTPVDGYGGPQAGADMEVQVSVTPEPTSVGLLGIGGLSLLRRRRK